MKRGAPAIAVLLLLIGVLSMVGGLIWEGTHSRPDRSATLPDSKKDAPPKGSRLNTAMLSARRAPDALARPAAQRRFTAKMDAALANAASSRCVGVFDGKATLYGNNLDAPLPVASNLKLVTAYVALQTMGPDTRMVNRFVATEDPSDGVINGDLWFVGGGDPVIDTATYRSTFPQPRPSTTLESIADLLVAKGVKTINGSIGVDESRYDTERSRPSWPQRLRDQHQAGPLSAAAVNDSRAYDPVLRDGKALDADNPPMYAGAALTALLVQRGVAITGLPKAERVPEQTFPLLEVESLPVREIIAEMLTFSDNNTAELLLKEIGFRVKGQGTSEAGLAVEHDVLTSKSLPLDGTQLLDGSGLDPKNRVTCQLLAEILASDGPLGAIAAGLPTAGMTGTLADRFKHTPLEGKMRAKTGSLDSVTALSGWITTPKGSLLSFTFVLTRDSKLTAADLEAIKQASLTLASYPEAVDATQLKPKLVS